VSRARVAALGSFAAAAALPALAWHDVAGRLAAEFRLQLGYLVTSWSGFGLLALGLVCFFPVLLSVGRSPDSRLYPRNRPALVAWGTSLYLLGLGLMFQIAQISGSV
jgi:hypothetical protein